MIKLYLITLLLAPIYTPYTFAIENKPEINKTYLGELYDLALCESSLNPLAYNPKDTDGKEKFGLFQFDKDTFNWALKRYGLEGDIWDYKLQLDLTQRLIKDGYARKWGCWPKVQNGIIEI